MKSVSENRIGIYVKSIMIACIFSLFVFVIMALLITYTDISETIIPILASIVMILSTLISGMYAGVKIKRKGLLNGLLVGVFFMIVIVCMSFLLIKDFKFEMYAFYKMMLGIGAGGIGGMIGVNFK
ncbi:TIGR04086 family membrane protein [Inediibacterium massiliense]|uniref:TIGR04086 family membrane protein n=1 Tax=Inediibacterium massiliense TaxID=1658111 RepID=UPI0006B5BD28|nr:TIGR04086 family membrane protein [Inediibacterium massiliense]